MASVSQTFGEGAYTNRPPLFAGENYSFWKIRIRIFLESVDKGVWDVVLNGPFEPTKVVDGIPVSTCNSTKEIWEVLEVTHEGTNEVKRARKNALIQEYEMFKNMDVAEKIHSHCQSFDCSRQTISESRDLTTMNMATLFDKLNEHELELGKLKEEEETEHKHSIALKATNKKASRRNESYADYDADISEKEFMSMMEEKNAKAATVTYDECGKEGHIKPDCPYLKIKQKDDVKYTQDRRRNKQKKVYIAWENSDEDSSNDDENSIEEETNMCLMVGSVCFESNNNNFENEPIKVNEEEASMCLMAGCISGATCRGNENAKQGSLFLPVSSLTSQVNEMKAMMTLLLQNHQGPFPSHKTTANSGGFSKIPTNFGDSSKTLANFGGSSKTLANSDDYSKTPLISVVSQKIVDNYLVMQLFPEVFLTAGNNKKGYYAEAIWVDVKSESNSCESNGKIMYDDCDKGNNKEMMQKDKKKRERKQKIENAMTMDSCKKMQCWTMMKRLMKNEQNKKIMSLRDIEQKLKRLEYSIVDDFAYDMRKVFSYPLGNREGLCKVKNKKGYYAEAIWVDVKSESNSCESNGKIMDDDCDKGNNKEMVQKNQKKRGRKCNENGQLQKDVVLDDDEAFNGGKRCMGFKEE
ncbi:hypothetical protein V8G54_013099 [Vigna mungo]|uniref:DUF4219 domain-containing protein n=1 Tax=Vigna mungo TaxID=3915 RepID=A0AAQ3NW66_VIGMU